MSIKKQPPALVKTKTGYAYNREYDYTTLSMIRLYAMGRSVSKNFNLLVVNRNEYGIQTIPCKESFNMKFTIYIPSDRNVYSNDGMLIQPLKKTRYDEDMLAEYNILCNKYEFNFIDFVDYFTKNNRWNCVSVSKTDPNDVDIMIKNVYSFGRITINDDVIINVDMETKFRFDRDLDMDTNRDYFNLLMSTISNKKNGVNGIMPASIFKLYSKLRWSNCDYRMPYITPSKTIKSLNVYDCIMDNVEVIIYTENQIKIYDSQWKPIEPVRGSNIKVFNTKYCKIFAFKFNVFCRMMIGKLRYRVVDSRTDENVHLFEVMYRYGVFRYRSRSGKNDCWRNMIILMGC
jgi:hypothetical protein